MSDVELYVSPSAVFSGYQKPLGKADYVIVGVPFDGTSTFRTGARFAPLAIREASLNIETFSFRSHLDIEDVNIHDLGGLHITHDVETTLQRLENVVQDLRDARKIPILLGGEHTLTLGAMRGVGGANTAVLSLDAHLDLRNEYMDLTTSHTTFMRRLHEHVKPAEIVEIGTRAVCREELDYAQEAGVVFFTTQEIQEKGIATIAQAIQKTIRHCGRTYLTIDMDVLDPAFAPAVQNPEPDGLSTRAVLDLVSGLCDNRLVGLDLVEVTPPYDRGVTAIQASKILFEALCQTEKTRS